MSAKVRSWITSYQDILGSRVPSSSPETGPWVPPSSPETEPAIVPEMPDTNLKDTSKNTRVSKEKMIYKIPSFWEIILNQLSRGQISITLLT